MHLADTPVLNSHENILPPTLAVTLGLVLSPLKSGHVIEKFISSCD
jgi:hypothetical protein